MAKRPERPRMGHATEQTIKNKALYAQFLTCFDGNGTSDLRSPCIAFIDAAAPINASHPVNLTTGGAGYAKDVLEPIQKAIKGLRRQDYVLIGGTYQGSEWVTSTGYYSGHFAEPLFGIPPSGKLAFLRFGEYHKIENGRIVESYIFLGLAELITAIGLWPLKQSQGFEGTVPGPATQDGIQLHANDPETSQANADMVEAMHLELTSEDQAWKPYWHDNMVWYGPGGLGSYATLEGFEAFQVPFEKTFDGWGDGQNEGITGVGSQCKSGDGNYVFLSGWPQLTGVHTGDFLGIKPTGNRVFMRDCDWWRIEDGKIIENWCMLDILHVALQLGRDVIAEITPKES